MRRRSGVQFPPAALLTGLVLPERRGGATLVHRELADLEFSGSLVAVNYVSRSRRRGISKPDRTRSGLVGEQPFLAASVDLGAPVARLLCTGVSSLHRDVARASADL